MGDSAVGAEHRRLSGRAAEASTLPRHPTRSPPELFRCGLAGHGSTRFRCAFSRASSASPLAANSWDNDQLVGPSVRPGADRRLVTDPPAALSARSSVL